VVKTEIMPCEGCQLLAQKADPDATLCEKHAQVFDAVFLKAQELTAADDASAKGAPAAADDGSAKGAPTALAGAIELPASSSSANGVRRWRCARCSEKQAKENSRYCAHCHVVESVRDSYFEETSSCLRCKVARLNATGNYCDEHRAEINAEVDKRLANH
jgi:hypothetical protein